MTQTQNKLIRKGLIEKCGDARAHVVQSAHRLESIPHNICRIPQHSTACSMKPAACCHPRILLLLLLLLFFFFSFQLIPRFLTPTVRRVSQLDPVK